ncbi:ABC transporter substrate-binding protein [Thermococcus paralvinellae]|uniref:Vitamin B12 ABC transporter B12-binding component n=1 Tax=Thermococcus paralvinellae TaxID=582419 RepID=W0I501_9EURY|nr:ABC transporter substrate-binding protein [Thermococcus paralvinellae]AHF79510.1 Vitamin B12 ABC transporter B12-binding component [Thermococcus paralvinellae]
MKSNKKFLTLLVLLVLVFSVFGVGCINQNYSTDTTSKTTTKSSPTQSLQGQKTETTTSKAKYPITITDFAGRTVTIEKPPERVIVLTSYWAEILCILGIQDKIVGIGKYIPYDPYLPDDVKKRPVVGSSFKGLNWETVASLNPDLIIVDWYGGKYKDAETIKKAEELGIPVIALSAKSVEDNIKVVELLGKVFGKKEKAEELASWMKEKLDEVNKITSQIPVDRKKNVLLISAPKDVGGPITVYAKGSAWASIVEFVGAHNLAFDKEFDTQWPKLDLEKIIAYWGDKADVIIVTSFSQDKLEKAVNDIKNDPRWREIKAVKEGHVYGILAGSKGFLDWGPRIVVGVYQMAGLIYPEYYPEWKLIAKELLENFYGIKYEAPVTVMDSMGRKVTFEKVPERVIVLSSYWAEVMYCLGVADKIVGIDKYTPKNQFLLESVKEKPQVGSTYKKGINWETVAGLNPDLIIMGRWKGSFTSGEQDVIEKSKELGFKVLAFGIPDSNVTGTKMPYENIRIIRVLGKVFDKERRAEELASFLEKYYNEALDIASKIPADKKKNVLIVYGSSIVGKYATGAIGISYKGSAYAETAELVGAHNVAFDYNFSTQYPKLDLEKLIAYFGDKTDVLIVVDWDPDRLNEAVEKIKSDPAWQEIKAVKEGNVVGILVSSWRKDATALYGPRFITGIYAFGHAIYPEYYPDWKPIYEELLKKFYGMEG